MVEITRQNTKPARRLPRLSKLLARNSAKPHHRENHSIHISYGTKFQFEYILGPLVLKVCQCWNGQRNPRLNDNSWAELLTVKDQELLLTQISIFLGCKRQHLIFPLHSRFVVSGCFRPRSTLMTAHFINGICAIRISLPFTLEVVDWSVVNFNVMGFERFKQMDSFRAEKYVIISRYIF